MYNIVHDNMLISKVEVIARGSLFHLTRIGFILFCRGAPQFQTGLGWAMRLSCLEMIYII